MENDKILIEFGIRLKHARKLANMSQARLAELCGYGGGRSVISMIETGQRSPPLSIIKKMADVLNTTPSALAFGDTSSITSENERQMLTMFWGLNMEGQKKSLEYVKDLFGNEKYRVK